MKAGGALAATTPTLATASTAQRRLSTIAASASHSVPRAKSYATVLVVRVDVMGQDALSCFDSEHKVRVFNCNRDGDGSIINS